MNLFSKYVVVNIWTIHLQIQDSINDYFVQDVRVSYNLRNPYKRNQPEWPDL